MIDFIGMIFPGSVAVLIFGAETGLWHKMEKLWGDAPEMAAKLVFIIVMGYFAGMLLHEAGDILEYLTGWNTPLNPRSWAAVVTGLARVLIPQYDSEAEKRSECRQQVKSAFGAMVFLVEMLSIVAISGAGKRLTQWIVSRQWSKSALDWGVNTLKIPGHTWNTMVAELFFICAFALELATLHGAIIRFFARKNPICTVGSVGRASCSRRGGRWFESSTVHHGPSEKIIIGRIFCVLFTKLPLAM